VMDSDVAHIPVLMAGPKFMIFEVKRSACREKNLIKISKEWWQKHIVDGEEPEQDGSPGMKNALKKKYTNYVPENYAVSTPDIDLITEQLLSAKNKIKKYKEIEEKCKVYIMGGIRDNEGIQGDGYTHTWRGKKKRTLHTKIKKEG